MISLILICLTVGFAFYFYRRQKLKYFEKLGIKGPSPNFLFGNLIEYRNTFLPILLQNWAKEYGKFFGYFEGSSPIMVISDPDLLQEILVKQFSTFHGRKLFPMQQDPDTDPRVSMFLARGKRWKRLRSTVNPAFSENKMRRMYPMVDECIQSMVTILKSKVKLENGCMDIQEPLQRMTMDIICKCAFGIETNCQTNINHPFIVRLKNFVTGQNFSTLKAAFILTFPELRELVLKFFAALNRTANHNPDLQVVREKMIEVIEARKKSSERRTDLLQLLLDSEIPDTNLLDEENFCPVNNISSLVNDTDDNLNNVEENTNSSKQTSSKHNKHLTTEEVIAQSILFLFAGYETSSTALSFIMHMLTEYPDVQKKLINEIDEVFQDKDIESMTPHQFYDAVSKLPYLTAVIFEVLRHHPFISNVITRLCLKSQGTYLSNGIFIKEGLNILPNVYALHFDSDVWTGTDPKIFFPERFLEKNNNSYEFKGPPHPLAWIPFGAGPRNCIGQRFAMMIMKSTIVRIFHQFTVSASSKTEFPLQLRIGGTISPKNGVHIQINTRTR